ncbi:DUF952 domain-containing protein [Brevundimonas balnearis]|uniref:DUF952 domain-containing protein n=1 Tax=Brevundimonas balnearis TaxID=1572858 RepID=A0ABV6R2Y3_9CAUL
MSRTAFKILDVRDWSAWRATGSFAGSAVDLADGYIHLSTEAQLAETARRHYAGRDDLVLVEVELDRAEGLRWEPSRGGELFPHLYAPLTLKAVVGHRGLSVAADGAVTLGEAVA